STAGSLVSNRSSAGSSRYACAVVVIVIPLVFRRPSNPRRTRCPDAVRTLRTVCACVKVRTPYGHMIAVNHLASQWPPAAGAATVDIQISRAVSRAFKSTAARCLFRRKCSNQHYTPNGPIGLANVLHQAGEHAADLDHFLLANRELAAGNDGGVSGELEMIFDLGRGGQRHLQEFREVLVGRSAGSLCDVRRNRERRSLKLANQSCMAATRNPFREPMNIQRDRVCLPPDRKSSIALHSAEVMLAASGAVIAEVRVGSISRA